MFEREDFDLLAQIVSGFEELVTTPHILTEVSNYSKNLKGKYKDKYFELFARGLASLGERYVRAADVSIHEVFSPFGLTDAGIAKIAADEVQLVVLTTDGRLSDYLGRKGVGRAHNFNHFRQANWESARLVLPDFGG